MNSLVPSEPDEHILAADLSALQRESDALLLSLVELKSSLTHLAASLESLTHDLQVLSQSLDLLAQSLRSLADQLSPPPVRLRPDLRIIDGGAPAGLFGSPYRRN